MGRKKSPMKGRKSPMKVVQQDPAAVVQMLPSPLPGRSATVWFERQVGAPQRLEKCPEIASALVASPGTKLNMRLELNANSVRNAFKRAGFRINAGQGATSVSWARHTGTKLWDLPAEAIVNHFPGSWALGRKDGLWKALSIQAQKHSAEYSFAPRTFLLPQDRTALEKALELTRGDSNQKKPRPGALRGNGVLIVKPLNSSRGRGVKMVLSTAELPSDPAAKLLVQEYIERPLLLQGRKFDLRLYVAVTSFDPLRAYVFEQGLARFAPRVQMRMA